MTQQYRHNTETKQFIEDRDNLGISFYQAPWIEATQEQAEAYELQEAKDSKIAQMKINRKSNINKDYISSQGNELIYNSVTGIWDQGELFYFHFSVKLTNSTSTNPEVILRAAKESDIQYSCDIIDSSVEDGIRKGYINLTAALSDDIGVHVRVRTQNSIILANNLTIEINACTTVAQVNAIDIEFDNVN